MKNNYKFTGATDVESDDVRLFIIRNGVKGEAEIIMDDTGMGYINYIKLGDDTDERDQLYLNQDEIQGDEKLWSQACDVYNQFNNMELTDDLDFTYEHQGDLSTEEYVDQVNEMMEGRMVEISKEEYYQRNEAEAVEAEDYDEAIRYRDALKNLKDEEMDEKIREIAYTYANREFSAEDLWDKEYKHDVKVIGVEYDGDELVDIVLDKPVLVDRLRWLEDEFRAVSGFPKASFTDTDAMRKGALRFAINGW